MRKPRDFDSELKSLADKATGEGWRKRGAAFFQGKSGNAASGPRQQPEGTLPLDGGAASA